MQSALLCVSSDLDGVCERGESSLWKVSDDSISEACVMFKHSVESGSDTGYVDDANCSFPKPFVCKATPIAQVRPIPITQPVCKLPS